MAGPTTILGNGHVSVSCALYEDNILGLKCFRGTDVSNVVGIQVVYMGNEHYLRSHPSSLTSKPHKNPAAYDAVMFEKSVERAESKPLKDVFLYNGLQLAKPPEGVRLVAFHPKGYKCQNNNMIPVVYMLGKKTAFELAIDQHVIGTDVFRFLGRDEDELLGTSEDIHA